MNHLERFCQFPDLWSQKPLQRPLFTSQILCRQDWQGQWISYTKKSERTGVISINRLAGKSACWEAMHYDTTEPCCLTDFRVYGKANMNVKSKVLRQKRRIFRYEEGCNRHLKRNMIACSGVVCSWTTQSALRSLEIGFPWGVSAKMNLEIFSLSRRGYAGVPCLYFQPTSRRGLEFQY